MAARWSQAQERSVQHWRRILESIGRRQPMAVVAEINELTQLCEMAMAVGGGPVDRCRHCVVFRDVSECADTRLDISAFLLGGENDRARAATTVIVERIEAARPPELR